MKESVCALLIFVTVLADLRIWLMRSKTSYYENLPKMQGTRLRQLMAQVLLVPVELGALCFAQPLFLWSIVAIHILWCLAAIRDNRECVLVRLTRASRMFGAGTPEFHAVKMFSAISSQLLVGILAFLVEVTIFSAVFRVEGAEDKDISLFILAMVGMVAVGGAVLAFFYYSSRHIYRQALERLAVAFPRELLNEQK